MAIKMRKNNSGSSADAEDRKSHREFKRGNTRIFTVLDEVNGIRPDGQEAVIGLVAELDTSQKVFLEAFPYFINFKENSLNYPKDKKSSGNYPHPLFYHTILRPTPNNTSNDIRLKQDMVYAELVPTESIEEVPGYGPLQKYMINTYFNVFSRADMTLEKEEHVDGKIEKISYTKPGDIVYKGYGRIVHSADGKTVELFLVSDPMTVDNYDHLEQYLLSAISHVNGPSVKLAFVDAVGVRHGETENFYRPPYVNTLGQPTGGSPTRPDEIRQDIQDLKDAGFPAEHVRIFESCRAFLENKEPKTGFLPGQGGLARLTGDAEKIYKIKDSPFTAAKSENGYIADSFAVRMAMSQTQRVIANADNLVIPGKVHVVIIADEGNLVFSKDLYKTPEERNGLGLSMMEAEVAHEIPAQEVKEDHAPVTITNPDDVSFGGDQGEFGSADFD
jgi:hypothetical protein